MAESLKKKTKKGLYWKFAEKFSEQGIQFIVGIFMARMLSPSDYGITALPAVFMMVAGILVNSGFKDALIRKPDLKDEDLSTAFVYSAGVGLFCYLTLFFASPWIADFYNTPVLKPLMRVTALNFLYMPIGTPQMILLKRDLNFKLIAKITVAIKILTGIMGIVFAFVGWGVWALVTPSLIGGVITQIILVMKVRWKPSLKWSKESFKYLWNFGNKTMASSLINAVYGNITPIIVGKYYSTAQLGTYTRATHYANLPSTYIYGVVREVSFPVLSKMQGDTKKMIANYSRMIRLSAFVCFPMMVVMSALARPLIILLVTAKWESCIILLQLICFSKMWYPIHALNLNILLVVGRTDLSLKLEVIKKVVSLVFMCCFLPFGLVAFCAAGIFSNMLHLFINTWYTGKLYGYGFHKQIKDLLPTLGLCAVMYLAIIGANDFINNLWLQLMVGIVIAATIYIGGSILFKLPEWKDAKYFINIRKK